MRGTRFMIILLAAALLNLTASAQQKDVCPSIRLQTKPRTKVQMNGKSVGNTPLVLKNLPHGTYVFSFSLPKYGTLLDTVTIDRNYPVCYTRKLVPIPEGDTLTPPMTAMPAPPAKIAREYIKRLCVYAEGMVSYLTGGAASAGITVGVDWSYLNVEMSYSCGLASTGTMYWYGNDKGGYALIQSSKYRPSVFGIRAGLRMRTNRFMTLTPQMGLDYTVLASSTRKANGHGASALSVTGGARMFFAINSFMGISFTPEYSFAAKQSEAFGLISLFDDGLKVYGENGLSLSTGLVFHF